MVKEWKKTVVFAGIAMVMAQQDPQMSMQFFNYSVINPGALGSGKGLCVNLHGRTQWVGFEGHPQTFALGAHIPVEMIMGGVGINIYYDALGLERNILGRIGYAFRYRIGPGTIGVGISMGIINKAISSDWVAVDPTALDVLIPDAAVSKMAFDMDAGIFYSTGNLWAGISALHITAPSIQKKISSGLLTDNFLYRVVRHYYFIGGYSAAIPSINLHIVPSLLVKSDGVSTQFDVNVRAILKEMFWGGLSFRFQDALTGMIGIIYPVWKGDLMVGYSYDLTISMLRKHSSGSHEVGVRYCMPITSAPRKGAHKTVRHL